MPVAAARRATWSSPPSFSVAVSPAGRSGADRETSLALRHTSSSTATDARGMACCTALAVASTSMAPVSSVQRLAFKNATVRGANALLNGSAWNTRACCLLALLEVVLRRFAEEGEASSRSICASMIDWYIARRPQRPPHELLDAHKAARVRTDGSK